MEIKGQETHEYRINFVGFRKAIRNKELTNTQKVLLIDIILYAGINNNSFPSQSILANDLGVTPRYISDLKETLRQKGYLTWERGRKGKSNRYKVSKELYAPFHTMVKSTSVSNRTPVQSSIGTAVPPNVVIESNHKSSQSPQQHFETLIRRKCTTLEIKRLHELTEKYSDAWVVDSIKEASQRHYSQYRVGLLSKILGDWKNTGKPPPKPKFLPCGKEGCDSGFIDRSSSSVVKCICRKQYEEDLKIWTQQWGNV